MLLLLIRTVDQGFPLLPWPCLRSDPPHMDFILMTHPPNSFWSYYCTSVSATCQEHYNNSTCFFSVENQKANPPSAAQRLTEECYFLFVLQQLCRRRALKSRWTHHCWQIPWAVTFIFPAHQFPKKSHPLSQKFSFYYFKNFQMNIIF